MVRHYIKKTNHKLASPGKLKKAVELMKDGRAVRAAARQVSLHPQTLWRFTQKTKSANTSEERELKEKDFQLSYVSRQVFSLEQEESIVSYCLDLCAMGYGLMVDKVRELAYEVAVKNNIKMPEKWIQDQKAGIDWFQGFRKRSKDRLTIRKPESCSMTRASCFNKPTVSQFYDKYEEVIKRHPSFQDGSRVFNKDETSTSTVQNDRKIVSRKGAKQVYQMKTAKRGLTATTTVIIGANGTVLPPAIIFSRKIFKFNMLINAFPGTLKLANENGYHTREKSYKILELSIQHKKSTKENPTLLLDDNVETHLSFALIDLAREFGIVILTFPPHCTHKMQPLDVGCFGPFKNYYNNAIHSFIRGVPTTIYHIACFVNESLCMAANPRTILNCFSKPGLYPFNRETFTDADFNLANVTDQPITLSSVSIDEVGTAPANGGLTITTATGELSSNVTNNEGDSTSGSNEENATMPSAPMAEQEAPVSSRQKEFVGHAQLIDYPKAKR